MEKYLIGLFGFTTFILLYFLFNLDKLETSVKIILRILSYIFPIGIIHNKYVATAIQNQINLMTEEIEKKAPGVMPAALKIVFVNEKKLSIEEKSKEKKIIIRLNYDRDRNKLFATSAYLYINKGFLNRAKICIDDLTRKSVDFTVTKRLLKNADSLSYFLDNYVQPVISDYPEIRELCAKIDALDEGGFFYEIFIRVMLKIGEEIFPKIPSNSILDETKDFLNFLAVISSKLYQVRVPLSFNGEFIKVGIILVRDEETYTKYGIQPYLNRFIINMNEGIELIFFKGIDEPSIDILRNVIKILKRRGLIQFSTEIFAPVKIKNFVYKRAIYIYTIPNKETYEFEAHKEKEELKQILIEEIPAIRNYEIEILNIVRIKGVLSKVLVKSKDPTIFPIHLCLGEKGSLLTKIKNRIGDEDIEFINYSKNIALQIRYAMFSRYYKKIFCKIECVDGVSKYEVSVPDIEAFNYVLDNNAIHKKLADKLIGVSTYIKVADK